MSTVTKTRRPTRLLWEQLEKIVNERREARISAASTLGAAGGHGGASVRDQGRRAADLATAFLGQRARSCRSSMRPSLPEAARYAATDVAKALEGYAVVVDWQHKEDVQRQMRRAIKERLRSVGMDAGKIEAVTAKVMDVARARLAR